MLYLVIFVLFCFDFNFSLSNIVKVVKMLNVLYILMLKWLVFFLKYVMGNIMSEFIVENCGVDVII